MNTRLLGIALALTAQLALAEVDTFEFNSITDPTALSPLFTEDFVMVSSKPQQLALAEEGLVFNGAMDFDMYFYRKPQLVTFRKVVIDNVQNGENFKPRSEFLRIENGFVQSPFDDRSAIKVTAGFTPAMADGMDGADSRTLLTALVYQYEHIMTPIPEPESYVLMLSGLAVLAIVARRRPNAIA